MSESFVVTRADLKVADRAAGVSGFMRIRNEEEFLALAVESHLPFLDELVIVHNRCTDRSPEIAEELRRRHPQKVRVYHYEPFVHSVASDEYAQLPPDSPHSLVNYYNYALCKTARRIAVKVDGDHVAIPDQFGRLVSAVRDRWVDRFLRRRRFVGILQFRGLNLWAKDGKFYVNTLKPTTNGDMALFTVTAETWHAFDSRFEVLERGSLRQTWFPELCFYHTKMMKKDRGFANWELDKYPNSWRVEYLRAAQFNPRLVPLEEYCATDRAARRIVPPQALGIAAG